MRPFVLSGRLRSAAVFVWVASVWVAGCQSAQTPEAVAAHFVDAYYLEKDHTKALSYCDGLAAFRVKEEVKLLQEAQGSLPASQPRAHSEKQKATMRPDDTEVIYLLTVETQGVRLRKNVRLVVKAVNGQNKVVQFSEHELKDP